MAGIRRLIGALLLAGILIVQPLPGQAADLSGNLAGFCFWFAALMFTAPLAASIAAQRLAPELPAPNRTAWMAAFVLFALLASIAGATGLDGIWPLLLAGLVWLGQRLARNAGWQPRRAWAWAALGLLGPMTYALVSGTVLFGLNVGLPYGFWLLAAPIWLAWYFDARRHRRVADLPAGSDP